MKNIVEIWKPIVGYDGYEISNLGRVKSLGNNKTRKEKILKSRKHKDGYLYVGFYKEGKPKMFSVHRLVAKAFIPNYDNLPQVNHINEDKTDNRVENLEWCSIEYNINYGSRNEKVTKSKSIPILQFSKTGDFIKKWDGIRQVEKELGFNSTHISKCCKGKRKTAYGFIWHYHYKSIWSKNHIPLKDKKVA